MIHEIDPNEWTRCIGKILRKSDMTITGKIIDAVQEVRGDWNGSSWWLILEDGRRVYANKICKIGELSVTMGVGL